MNKIKDQIHLSYKDTINLGSYYTPDKLIKNTYTLIKKYIPDMNEYIILDNSCGYGAFLNPNYIKPKRFIGADIDYKAIDKIKNRHNLILYSTNSLQSVTRKKYNILDKEKLIIVGNPPYNDTTSIIRNNIKKCNFQVDNDLKVRDLGMSFLLSYNKLNSDYICVLHPLSYLIKKTNFNLLKNFNNNYKLIDSAIFNSQEFSKTSKIMGFPIIIALYKKSSSGMTYDFIYNYSFKTIEGKKFKLNKFDYIDNYITKYPNKKLVTEDKRKAYFWTMRDINALKRSKTFIKEDSYNAIYITEGNFDYYCYVDAFKDFIKNIPYYFGNLNIIINKDEFLKIKSIFRKKALLKHSYLFPKEKKQNLSNQENNVIKNYFKNLLGTHYEYR